MGVFPDGRRFSLRLGELCKQRCQQDYCDNCQMCEKSSHVDQNINIE